MVLSSNVRQSTAQENIVNQNIEWKGGDKPGQPGGSWRMVAIEGNPDLNNLNKRRNKR